MAILAILPLYLVGTKADATVYTATNANFGSVFYAAKAGDRIVLSGSFAAINLSNRSWSTAVVIDARNARFTDSVQFKNIAGLNVIGGAFGSTSAIRYGDAVAVFNSSRISVDGASFIGNREGGGLRFSGGHDLSVSRSSFTAFKRGLSFTGVTGGIMSGNRFLASSGDGAAIVNSHFVTASNNVCSGTSVTGTTHPDCIQLWSLAGNPVQSDITLIDNQAFGSTQGFTSFDPARGGGLRITMMRNLVENSWPQGIACYACVDSVFTDNVLRTLPGSRFRTNMYIVGGSNNLIARNSFDGVIYGGTAKLAPNAPGAAFSALSLGADALALGADVLATGSDLLAFDPDAAGGATPEDMITGIGGAAIGVPEPLVWLEMLAGLSGVGMALRRRQTAAA